MNKLGVILSLLYSAACAAFLPPLVPLALEDAIKRGVASQSLDWIQSSDSTHEVIDPAWIQGSSMYQAISCAEDECDANEIIYHVSSLRQLDDECLFHQAFESEPTMECSNTKDRHLVQRILELKHELHSLQQELDENEFANAIKDEHERALQEHWYKDYLEFYHM